MVELFASLALAFSIPSSWFPSVIHVHKAPKPKPIVWNHARASWYDDSGTTASGLHYQYGFAALIFGNEWGTKVEFCYRRCQVGQLDDHGPYISGRTFDFNPALEAATGSPSVESDIRWRVVK